MKNKLLLLFLFIIFNNTLFSKTIVDMSNTKVEVPDKIERIFGSAPPTTFLIALYNPELLVGLNFPASNENNLGSEEYLGKHFMSLPILGGWHGNQKGASIEKLLSVNAQVILAWQNEFLLEQVQNSLKKVEVPIVMVDADNLEKTPQTFRFLGELLNNQKRGEELALYAEQTLSYIEDMTKKIPKNKEATFYYAQGNNGLQSDCQDSFHTTQFRFIKAKNIFECVRKDIVGMENLSFETILKANPEYIIVQSAQFYDKIFTDTNWQMLDAVKQKKVYLVPKVPFNWIDRPPSFMRLLGIHWLSSIMYKDIYTKDINKEIKTFYKLFFNVNLSDEVLKNITKNAL